MARVSPWRWGGPAGSKSVFVPCSRSTATAAR
jgi:hypothetical protein